MSKKVLSDTDCLRYFNINLNDCTFLGEGRYGRVFLMPDGNVIKIFKDEESCLHEYILLQSVKGNKHFPMAFACRGNCMIREYIGGICIEDYVKKFGLSRRLSLNLINLIEDFRRLGFARLDIRCSHIFVQPDESVMVIDPRKHYSISFAYPDKMLKKLKKLHVIKRFMDVLKEERPYLYNTWKEAV